MNTIVIHSCSQYLEDFVSGAGEGGFVYVSMGTSVRTENMPPQLLRTLVDAFAKLAPYRVLWKFEGTLGDSELPPNVKIERWLPQQDILGKRERERKRNFFNAN